MPMSMAPSRLTSVRVVRIDRTSATPPKMKPRLNMLEPTTLPTEMSAWPRNAAFTVTANSGAEVPNATMVRPMTSSDIPSRLAKCAAPSTSQTAPHQSPRTVATIISMSSAITIASRMTGGARSPGHDSGI